MKLRQVHKTVRDALDAWLAGRPPEIKRLAAEFPMGASFELDNGEGVQTWYLLGYVEPDGLLVSKIDPFEDYDLAQQLKVLVCAAHVRGRP